ncbi:hypothetical protein FJZ48_02190 [Candidatus Uhrbacteria bacterium]|nr:hypothetical protein [Candidatus Uhrbacteria bacterium]
MRFLLTLTIGMLISSPVLADQKEKQATKEKRAAKAWLKRNEKKTLRKAIPPKVLNCVEEEMVGSVPISPDEKLGDVSEETIIPLYHIYLDCKDEVERKEKKRPVKRGRRALPPPRDHTDWPPRQTDPPAEDARGFAGVFLLQLRHMNHIAKTTS